MTTNFKTAEASDIPVLLQLIKEYYEYDGHPYDEDTVHNALKKILTDVMLGRVWLITRDDLTIGYLVLCLGFSLEFKGRDAFIDELYIRSDYRGMGIGRLALKFVEEYSRSLGVRALHLEVERHNKNAQLLYKKFGFGDHDRYLMTKERT
jgi:diamine N-acetyltransferase